MAFIFQFIYCHTSIDELIFLNMVKTTNQNIKRPPKTPLNDKTIWGSVYDLGEFEFDWEKGLLSIPCPQVEPSDGQ